MLVKRAFRFKLVPTREQLELFLHFAGARRWVFNRGLDQRIKTYESTGKSPTYFEQNIELTTLKEVEETSWLSKVHSQVLQQGLKDLDNAFKHFFRRVKKGEKPGHPKFKKRGNRDGFRYPQGVKVENTTVFLPKIGWVKFRKSREVQGEINETTIVQEGSNWFVSFSCEWEKPSPQTAPIDEKGAVGIDVGLIDFATLAIGEENVHEKIDNPKYLKKSLAHLKYLSRKVSKKVKNSKRRYKAKIRLSKLHAQVKNRRNDFVQKLSTKMIKNHDIFCIETLDISNMLQESPKGRSRAIADAGWRGFLHCLKYKAEELGKHLVEAGKYFAGSQICSGCHHQQKMPLSLRVYDCPICKLKICRDYNSAINHKAAGMSVLKARGAALIRGSVEAGILRL